MNPSDDSSKFRLLWATSCITVLAVGTLWIGFDGRLYWHDVRFLYACSQLSMDDVLAGVFNPHQAWSRIDELGSGGFYASKVLHLWLLHAVYAFLPPEQGGLELSIALSASLVLGAVALSYFFFSQVSGSRGFAILAASCVAAAPVTPYLLGKLLSESTSFLLTTLSLLVIVRSHRASSLAWPALAGVLLALAALSRLDSILGVTGFLLAGVIVNVFPAERRVLIRQAGITVAAGALIYIGMLQLSGVSLPALTAYLNEFIDAPRKSLLMSALGIVTFAGALYLPATVALAKRPGRLTYFFLVWLLVTWIPILFMTSNYMVEPRYLVQGLLPFAGLAAVGIQILGKRLRTDRIRAGVAAIALLLTLGVNHLAVALMPYELDRHAILRAVAQIVERGGPEAYILVPWAYTDFHFLAVMRPDLNVVNVNFPSQQRVDTRILETWVQRLQKTYGNRYLIDPNRLRRLMDSHDVYYLGWRRYPPLEAAGALAAAISERLEQVIGGLGATDHLTQSWLWTDPGLKFHLVNKVGQYEIYDLQAIPR